MYPRRALRGVVYFKRNYINNTNGDGFMNLRYALSLAFVSLSAFTACSDESNPVTKDTTLSSSCVAQTPVSSSDESSVLSSSSVEKISATFIEPCKTADADNCEYDTLKDDRLYKWDDATKACPNGWRMPSKIEFDDLFVIVGGRLSAGQVLKSTSGWNSDGNGRDAYGFSAIPAGYWDEYDSYGLEGSNAYFWSSTVSEHSDGSAFNMYLNYSTERKYPDGSYDEAHLDTNYKRRGLSVRCVKD